MSNHLPDFPLDDTTLDLLEQSLDPGEMSGRSSLNETLLMLSMLGGSDPSEAMHQDQFYGEGDCLRALIGEVRRLRKEQAA